MIAHLVRTAIGFGGGFLALWLAFNIEPRLAGIAAGIATFFAAIVLSNIGFNLLAHRPGSDRSRLPDRPPT